MSQDPHDQTTDHGTEQGTEQGPEQGAAGADAAPTIPLTIGRTGTWTMLPDWVALSGISAKAQALYWQLALHLNRRRGDRVVFPSRQNLAARLGFTRPQTIDRYLTELIHLGAIDKRTTRSSGMRTRNFYVLHLEPRPGYRGPRSLTDIIEAEPDPAARNGQAPRRRAEPSPNQPAQAPATGARTRTPVGRVRAPRLDAYAHPGWTRTRTLTRRTLTRRTTTTRRPRTRPVPGQTASRPRRTTVPAGRWWRRDSIFFGRCRSR